MAWSSPPSGMMPASTSRTRTSTTTAATTETVDETYYSPSWSNNPLGTTSEELEVAAGNYAGSTYGNTAARPGAKITLTRWLSAKVQDYPELRDMESLHLSIQMACKTISNLVQTSSTAQPSNTADSSLSDGSNPRDNSMKRLDQISKNVLQNALRFTGRLRVVEAPRNTGNNDEEGPRTHQPGVTIAYALDQYTKDGTRQKMTTRGGGGENADPKWGNTRRLAACFDPLDGSGNADAAICTGTVFGVFDADAGFKGGETPDLRDAASLSRAVLQPGNKLLAAGYCLYSSTTMLVFTLGGGTHGFTLDKTINEFVLTHPNMKIPKRGNIYSCNEAYSEGWDDKFKGYLKRLKTGKGETGQRYTQRYVGSMVGDVHRTLMYGGIFCCPSDTEVHHKGNLQLVYKSAPMAYILEHAGGKATDGNVNLLSVQPNYVHERSPCFMGSPEDMDELTAHLGSGSQ
eukprot:CAMPEP_0201890690 /NCGR_PEP_ID=MMETSP0902-20130614/32752_1 /ASSEMBLY_ACC=CAM_ASM_000551 /TAXON_ID=420261 /ORGANISM="Thalassiosira antarctica, Strain CCMP982" /LENGTH=458 /DNA_ID=CAMNT_0048421617 /DNA_START=192 /DNA_END=1568 /DNA_ORIENTATION=+